MLAVECLFYPEEFILRNNIDYKTIYLSKYYNPLRLKQVIFYENRDSLSYILDQCFIQWGRGRGQKAPPPRRPRSPSREKVK
jgi:hypothetical protein